MPSIENKRRKLEAFVKVRSIDSLLTHLKHIFLFQHQEKICGSFGLREIKIWMSSNSVIGAFYPVIHLTFDTTINKITIKSKMNQVGVGLCVLINTVIIWSALNLFILRAGLSNDSLFQRIILFLIFMGIFNFPMFMSYRGARDVLIKEIKNRLQDGQPR